MSQQSQKFCTSHAKNSTWTPGLRTFFEYRDLGIGNATHGQFNAHVIRVKKPVKQFFFNFLFILRSCSIRLM